VKAVAVLLDGGVAAEEMAAGGAFAVPELLQGGVVVKQSNARLTLLLLYHYTVLC